CKDEPTAPPPPPKNPSISLSTSSVGFNATENGALPAAQIVQVTNGGGGTLSGLAVNVTYSAQSAPSGPAWLQASLNKTTAPATITLSMTTTAMAVGSHTASISVSASGASNSPRTIQVTCTLTGTGGTPQIALSRTAVSFSATAGGANPASETVSITNGAGGSLTGLAANITYQGGQPTGWLSRSLSSTSAPSTLTLNATTGSLAAGTYNATVSVSSPVAGNSPRTIAVTFTVTSAPPTMGSIRVNVSTGGQNLDPTGYVVRVTDPGGAQTTNVNTNGYVVFSNLAVGSHTVTLQDVAANCVVGGSNPRSVNVVAGTTAQTTFNVTCSAPTTGSIRVNVVTGGQNLDPDGYVAAVSIGGGFDRLEAVNTNGYVVVPDLAPGAHTVRLQGVASNCVVGGSNPRSVNVVAGSMSQTTFNVTCSAPAVRRVKLVNSMNSGLNLQQVVQFKVASTEAGVYTRNDLLTNDPARCLNLPGEAIDRGYYATFDINVGDSYAVYIGIGIWDLDNVFCQLYYNWFKRTYFTDPSFNTYYVWTVVLVNGHQSGEWQWTITGSYLNGTLKVTPANSAGIAFNVTPGNPIP
ncbi:MAG: hypothetical protein OEO21_10350, partial [Candidatus Krumholzibacteria bacterium]|nr:hypothetical protein [Candidatus Krumholzibacteria bacterium]